MKQKTTIFDLFSGAGGMSKGFIDAGFDVVAAMEVDEYTKQIYMQLISPNIPILSDASTINLTDINDFDILTAKIPYSFSSSKSSNKEKGNLHLHYFISIIKAKMPKAFLLETTSAFVRSNENNYYLSEITDLGYVYSYAVLETQKCIGLPVNENKLYIVGFRSDFQNKQFTFPQNAVTQIEIEEILDLHAITPAYYYKKNIRIEHETEIEKNKMYIIQGTQLIRKDRIRFFSYYPSLIFDDHGIRKITLNELAIFKGLTGVNFENFKNKTKTERAICTSSNAYVIRELANLIRKHLGHKGKIFEEIDSSYLKKQLYSQNNTLQYKEYKQTVIRNTKTVSLLREEKSKPNKKAFPMYGRKINTIYLEKLKGLKNVEITFDKALTAIMGVNGSGKSTILHALACTYKSDNDQRDKYMFSDFFLPNPDSTWKGSNLNICYSYMIKGKSYEQTQHYKKDSDRWFPRYNNRPDRNVYYIGISSCVPDIETEKSRSYISYTTKYETDDLSNLVRDYAKFILNKNYSQLTTHGTKHRNYMGVKLQAKDIQYESDQEIAATTEDYALVYSSLSMGTGEQRVLKILREVLSAEKESLILIDEIELLLHTDALKKLIKALNTIAQKNTLQIIFTTHSLIMQELLDIVDIRFLQNFETKTMVYHNIDNDAMLSLSGTCPKPIRLFVEDRLARGIIHHLLKALNMKAMVQVTMFGDARNAFTLASGEIIRDADVSKTLIIIDGDVYVNANAKEEQIRKVFSGTEEDKDEKRKEALSLIKQFDLSGEKYPEKFIFNMLKRTLGDFKDDNEIQQICRPMISFEDSHSYINEIISILGDDYEIGLRDILSVVSNSLEWNKYIAEIKNWLLEKRSELSNH
jgi:site-specific DNA-cytosine methylase/energy-coupling factor transporter ATP-binding protein EcfA2